MDYMLDEFSEVSLSTLIKWAASGAMIFGGMVPYIPQYQEIRRTEDAEGFSLFVCLALLVANTLRILFWFGKRYEIPLLLQSLIMNATMLAMVHLCVNMHNKNQIIRGKDRVFTAAKVQEQRVKGSPSFIRKTSKELYAHHFFSDFDSRYFWAWTDFMSYVDFMLIFTIIFGILMYIFIDYIVFVEIIGFLALFTEALLGFPQLLRNFRNKSTVGMSIKMVAMWLLGDTFKTIYFLARDAPLQFWLCGMLQVCIDIIILFQVYLYRRNLSHHAKKQDLPD